MRVVFVNQFHPPDVASSGQHLFDLARAAARAGCQVEVISSRSAYEGGRLRAPHDEVREGVRVRRLPSWGPRSRRTRWRLLDALVWHLFVMAWVIFHRREVIVTLTSPPLVTVWGTLHSLLHRSRHVAWTMDLHPDVEFALGVTSRRSVAGRVLGALDRFSLRHATAVVSLGPGQKRRLLAKGVSADRLSLVPIWPSGPEPRAAAPREGAGPLRVLYSGNAGHAHRFAEVLDAATTLQATGAAVRFDFAGGGAARPDLEREAARRGLRNLRFLPYRRLEELEEQLAAADVHLVTLRPEMSGIAVPSKLQSALAVGRPVVFVGGEDADAAQWLREGGGYCFGPGQGGDLAATLVRLASHPEERRRRGEEARALFERRFRCEDACAAIVAIIRNESPPRRAEREVYRQARERVEI